MNFSPTKVDNKKKIHYGKLCYFLILLYEFVHRGRRNAKILLLLTSVPRLLSEEVWPHVRILEWSHSFPLLDPRSIINQLICLNFTGPILSVWYCKMKFSLFDWLMLVLSLSLIKVSSSQSQFHSNDSVEYDAEKSSLPFWDELKKST